MTRLTSSPQWLSSLLMSWSQSSKLGRFLLSCDLKVSAHIRCRQTLYSRLTDENPWLEYIQLFENKGAMMGCSNPHPHGQSWSLSYVPSIARKQLDSQLEFSRLSVPDDSQAPALSNGKPSLLLSYAHSEMQPKPSPRVIFSTDHFVAMVPYWALWPFEVMILPYKRHIASVLDLMDEERLDLANALRRATCRMDNLFQTSFRKPSVLANFSKG